MLKRLVVLGAIATVTLAFAAQAGQVQGANGQGTARAGDGRIGEFNFEVIKRTINSHSRLEGRLVFSSSSRVNNNPVHTRITLHELGALAVEGHACEFSGAGLL